MAAILFIITVLLGLSPIIIHDLRSGDYFLIGWALFTSVALLGLLFGFNWWYNSSVDSLEELDEQED